MKLFSIKVPVQNISLSDFEADGSELVDKTNVERDVIGDSQGSYLLSKLTRIQREVVELKAQGYDRKEIATIRGVSLQSIHQIFPRIKLRLKEYER